MKAVAIVLTAVLLTIGLWGTAQAAPWMMFPWWGLGPEGGEKSPNFAALSSLFPPISWGHFYVGDWGKGLIFSGGEAFLEIAFVGTAIYESSQASVDSPRAWTHMGMFSGWSREGTITLVSIGVIYVGFKFWEAFDAALTAEDYNRRQRQTSQVEPYWEKEEVGLRYSFKF